MRSGRAPSPAGGPEALPNARARRTKWIPGSRLRAAATLLVLAAAAAAFLQYGGADAPLTGAWIVAPSVPEWLQMPDAIPGGAFAQVQDTAFITTWNVGPSPHTISLPLEVHSGGTIAIDWGDGNSTSVTENGTQSHAYSGPGDYQISMTGDLSRINLGIGSAVASQLASIDQWGDIEWSSMEQAFKSSFNMVYRATDSPDLSGVTSTNQMFSFAVLFDGNLSEWDTSSVTDMTDMFESAVLFDGNLSEWDTSSVTHMNNMFLGATLFDGDISEWNVSSVTHMNNMFREASAFNGNLSEWDTSSVTHMNNMFREASAFNGNLSKWNVSSVTRMNSMFTDATSFEQNLGGWYVIPANTAYGVSEGTLRVTTISAQNAVLDGHNPNYRIGSGGDSDSFNMTGNALTFKATPSAGNYMVNVTAPGGDFGTNNHRVLSVTVTDTPNQPPTVTAITGATAINEGASGTLTGTATDSDGTISLYLWNVDDASAVTITSGNSATLQYTASQVDSDTPVTFTLTVTDDYGAPASLDYPVTVRDVPPPPGTFDATITPPDSPTNQDPTFGVTFGSAVPAEEFTPDDVGTSPSGLAVSVSGSGTSFSFTITGAPDGMITAHVPAGAVSDDTGDSNAASNRVSVTVDKTDPQITSARVSGSDTITVSFSEGVRGSTAASDWPLQGAPGVAVDSATGLPGGSVTLGLSEDLPEDRPELTLDYTGTGILDLAGNPLGVAADIAVSYPSSGRSRGQSAPPVVDIGSVIKSYPQSVPEWVSRAAGARDPGAPIPPIATNGTFAFPLEINSLGYLLDGSLNTLVPHVIPAGQPVTIKVTVHDPTPIAYFAVYLNLQGNEISHLQSDAQVIWDSGEVRIIDPYGLMQDVAITLSEDPEDPARKTATITVTPSEGIGETNMVIRTRNAAGQITEVKIFDALDVRAPEPEQEPAAVDPEPGAPLNVIDPAPEPAGEPEPADGSSLPAIRMWSGFEPESITDAELLEALGLDYPGADVPDWVMTELGPLAARGDITVDEFKAALEYVLEHVLGNA